MNQRAYDLIVFDWDGTLMDSAAKIVQCFERAFADAAQPSPGDKPIRQIIGLGLTEAIAALLPQADAATHRLVGDRYRNYFLGLDAAEMPLFPRVREGLEVLTAQGYLLAIATGKSRRGLDRVLGNIGLSHLFVATRCADEAHSKPHPKMLEDILDDTGMNASQALMVGDTTYDMIMANTIGMHGLAVSYGVHTRADLLVQAPIACCDSFEEVCAWIQDAGRQRPSAVAARS